MSKCHKEKLHVKQTKIFILGQKAGTIVLVGVNPVGTGCLYILDITSITRCLSHSAINYKLIKHQIKCTRQILYVKSISHVE